MFRDSVSAASSSLGTTQQSRTLVPWTIDSAKSLLRIPLLPVSLAALFIAVLTFFHVLSTLTARPNVELYLFALASEPSSSDEQPNEATPSLDRQCNESVYAFAQQHPAIAVKPVAVERPFAKQLHPTNSDYPSVRIAYLCGSPHINHESVQLTTSVPQQQRQHISIDLQQLFSAFAETSIPTLVLLDINIDQQENPSLFPEYTTWSMVEQIEHQLRGASFANLSVLVRFNMVPAGQSPSVISAVTRASQSSLAGRLAGLDLNSADQNEDGLLTLDEVTIALSSSIESDNQSHNQLTLGASFTDTGNKFPVLSLSSKTEKVASTEAAKKQEPTVPTAVPTATESLSFRAPTAFCAMMLSDAGIASQHDAEALQLITGLRDLCQPDTNPSDFDVWLKATKSFQAPWPLLRWTEMLFASQLDFETKKLLLQGKLDIDFLALNAVDEPLRQRFQSARLRYYAAFRGCLNPDRLDAFQTYPLQLRRANADLANLRSQAELLQTRQRLFKEINPNLLAWILSPVNTKVVNDDWLIQLLTLASGKSSLTELSGAIADQSADDTIEHLELLLQLAEHNGKANSEQPETLQPLYSNFSGANTSGPADLVTESTRSTHIRLVRIKLALETHKKSHASLQQHADLLAAIDSAIKVLSGSTIANQHVQRKIYQVLTALRESPLETFVHPKLVASEQNTWPIVFNRVAAALVADRMDATAQERSIIDEQWNYCLQIIPDTASGLVSERISSPLQVSTMGNLVDGEPVTVSLQVAPSFSFLQGSIEIEYDPRAVSLQFAAGTPPFISTADVASRSYETGLQQILRSTQRPIESCSFTVQLAATQQQLNGQPVGIILRLVSGNQIERTYLPLTVPQSSLGLVRLTANPKQPGDSQLLPNHLHQVPLQFQSQIANQKLGFRLLNIGATASPVPLGSLTSDDAQAWLSQCQQTAVLATAAERVYPSIQLQTIPFTPVPVDPKKSIETTNLVLEATDSGTKRLQYFALSPEIVRPLAFIAPTIRYDANTLHVNLSLEATDFKNAAWPNETVVVECTVTDQDQLHVFAKARVASAFQSPSTTVLQLPDQSQGYVYVNLSVNGWKNAFRYRLPTFEDSVITETDSMALGVALEEVQQPIVVPRETAFVSASAETTLSDNQYRYGVDELRIGIDRNRNRTLADDDYVLTTRPVQARVRFDGVAPNGSIVLTTVATPSALQIPTADLNDGRYELLAEMQHGARQVWSLPRELVVDSTPAVIRQYTLQSPPVPIVGKPCVLSVDVDDMGLSGAAQLAGGWSPSGEINFAAVAKPVLAQRTNAGLWTLTVPTDGMASGQYLLLLQATDNAGNVSPPFPVSMTVWTEADLAKQTQHATTQVQGAVRYVSLPAAGLEIHLEQLPSLSPATETGKNPASKQESGQTATEQNSEQSISTKYMVVSDKEGRFHFPAVRAGEYRLTISGLYRGMTVAKEQKISVLPPLPTIVDAIRID